MSRPVCCCLAVPAGGCLRACGSSSWCRSGGTVARTSLLTASRCFVEHSTDPKKWRSPENDEVRRQYGQGVPLHSGYAEVQRRAEIERRLVEEDKFTDWYAWYTTGAVCALFLVFLNVIVEFVEPEPSPEYVPYEKKEKK